MASLSRLPLKALNRYTDTSFAQCETIWGNMDKMRKNVKKNTKKSEHIMFPSVERESSKAGFSYMGLPGVVEGSTWWQAGGVMSF